MLSFIIHWIVFAMQDQADRRLAQARAAEVWAIDLAQLNAFTAVKDAWKATRN